LIQIAAIGAGFSGVDRAADRQTVTAIFEAVCPGVRLVLDNDATPALIAGVGRRFGVLTVCGTGMIALGYNASGERARSGGWGSHDRPGQRLLDCAGSAARHRKCP